MRKWLMALALIVSVQGAQPASADAGFLHVTPALSLASPCGDGTTCLYTWSLATRLGQALSYAEERYGVRDSGWTILGVEFTTRDAPQVWYPRFAGKFGMIVVQLTDEAAQDERRALFQLSHEVFHLLSPAGPGERASVLEEGLATYNSIEFVNSVGFSLSRSYINDRRYEAAYDAVLDLKRQTGNLRSGVKALRRNTGKLSGISHSDILAAFPGTSLELAIRLAADF